MFHSLLSTGITVVNKESSEKIPGCEISDYDTDAGTMDLDCQENLINSYLSHAATLRNISSALVRKFLRDLAEKRSNKRMARQENSFFGEDNNACRDTLLTHPFKYGHSFLGEPDWIEDVIV